MGRHDKAAALTDPTLVGRHDEMTVLQAQYTQATKGRGALVLLEGESGGGKTRLMNAFLSTWGLAIARPRQRPGRPTPL